MYCEPHLRLRASGANICFNSVKIHCSGMTFFYKELLFKNSIHFIDVKLDAEPFKKNKKNKKMLGVEPSHMILGSYYDILLHTWIFIILCFMYVVIRMLFCQLINKVLGSFQLAFRDAIYLVDAIQGGEKIIKACKPALESSYITKVIHDCRRDSEVSKNSWLLYVFWSFR